jgi:hypothetical protein
MEMTMKKLLAFALVAILAGTAMGDTFWEPSYVFMNDGVGDTWYDLNAAFQSENFDGADLGTFTLTDQLWLNTEINVSDNEGATWEFVSVWYRLNGTGGFTQIQDTSLTGSNPYQGVTAGVNLIPLANLGVNTIEIYLARNHSWSGGSYTAYLNTTGEIGGGVDPGSTPPAGDYFTAEFAVIPEPATMSLLGIGALAMVLRRKIRK